MDDEKGGKAMNPMDSVFDLDALRAALPLGSACPSNPLDHGIFSGPFSGLAARGFLKLFLG